MLRCTVLHRLAEANLQGIAKEVLALYNNEGRRLVAEAVARGLLQVRAVLRGCWAVGEASTRGLVAGLV